MHSPIHSAVNIFIFLILKVFKAVFLIVLFQLYAIQRPIHEMDGYINYIDISPAMWLC